MSFPDSPYPEGRTGSPAPATVSENSGGNGRLTAPLSSARQLPSMSGMIEGYLGRESVTVGGEVTLHISTDAPASGCVSTGSAGNSYPSGNPGNIRVLCIPRPVILTGYRGSLRPPTTGIGRRSRSPFLRTGSRESIWPNSSNAARTAPGILRCSARRSSKGTRASSSSYAPASPAAAPASSTRSRPSPGTPTTAPTGPVWSVPSASTTTPSTGPVATVNPEVTRSASTAPGASSTSPTGTPPSSPGWNATATPSSSAPISTCTRIPACSTRTTSSSASATTNTGARRCAVTRSDSSAAAGISPFSVPTPAGGGCTRRTAIPLSSPTPIITWARNIPIFPPPTSGGRPCPTGSAGRRTP